jgi:hypothetical protein
MLTILCECGAEHKVFKKDLWRRFKKKKPKGKYTKENISYCPNCKRAIVVEI